jgi:hypothetical protein
MSVRGVSLHLSGQGLGEDCQLVGQFFLDEEGQTVVSKARIHPPGEGCRIRFVVDGGYRFAIEDWPAIFEKLTHAMIRLDRVMRARVAAQVLA